MKVLSRIARHRQLIGFNKAADALRWAMAWSALMAGFAWVFVRVWADPSSRGERRERAAFLGRILRRVRQGSKENSPDATASSQDGRLVPAAGRDHRRTRNMTSSSGSSR